MKANIKFSLAILGFLFVFCIGCTEIHPNFTYSPEMPTAGQLVTFTNNTTEGEVWNWTFGDGGTATAKNPTKTYKAPGVYNVTLRVDSNDNFTVTKQITIYDTIPSIYTESDEIYYYQDFTLSVLAYNPYNHKVSYEWTFSDNAISDDIVDNVATTATVTLLFKDFGIRETVNLKITIGESIYNVSKAFYVNDVKANSLLMVQEGGKILRQRIFNNGKEDYTELDVTLGENANNIHALNNKLYIFEANTSAEGAISVVNMDNNSIETVISNSNSNANGGYFNGFVRANSIYWSDLSNFIYTANITTRNATFEWAGNNDAQVNNAYYLVKADRLGYFGNGLSFDQATGGFCVYDDTYFWAKKGTGKGIYRFTASDILTANVSGVGVIPSLGAILTDYAIEAFVIDEMNLKIYFSVPSTESNKGLWVCSINGAKPVQISTETANGIAIDSQSNKVYWSTEDNVMSCELTRSVNNTIQESAIEVFLANKKIKGLTIDRVLR